LVLVAIPFAVHHVRVGLHPALAAGQGDDDSRNGLYRLVTTVTSTEERGAGAEDIPAGADAQELLKSGEAYGVGGLGLVGVGSGGGAKDEEKPERLMSFGRKLGGSRRSAEAQNLQSY